jgi:hypothetical protein
MRDELRAATMMRILGGPLEKRKIMRKTTIRFILSAMMSMLFPLLSFGQEESAGHAKVREFACGNDPFQQCMDALIRLCGNPARMSCAVKHRAKLMQISSDAAK